MNANIAAGDTVYLRGGTYEYPILLVNIAGGTSENRFTIQAYADETPLIMNSTVLSSTYVYQIRIQATDYVTIDGLSIFATEPTDYTIALTNSADHCQLLNLDVDGGGPSYTSGYVRALSGSDNGVISGCVMYDFGRIATSGDDLQGIIQIGTESSGDDNCDNWTIANNDFYNGSHHLVETFGKYNYVHSNRFRNTCWQPDNVAGNAKGTYTSGIWQDLYGNRCYQVESNQNDYDAPRYTVIERNRFGGSGVPPDDNGDAQLCLSAANIIARYNTFYNGTGRAVYYKNGDREANYNKVYNNTMYINTLRPTTRDADDGDFEIDQQVIGLSNTVLEDTNRPVLGASIVNNIIYDTAGRGITFLDPGTYDANTYADIRGNLIGAYNGSSYAPSTTDPLFLDDTIPDDYSDGQPNLAIPSNSPCVDAGTHLTEANGAGASSTTLVVDDAMFFQPGGWGSDQAPTVADVIAIGTVGNTVTISSIDYATNTITLASAMTWSDNDPIYLYSDAGGNVVLYDSAPDQGAWEFGMNIGTAYGGRLRFDGTGSKPVLTDGTGSVPIKTN